MSKTKLRKRGGKVLWRLSAKQKMGRPPVLTKELVEKVCTYVRTGAYIEIACLCAGIAKAVFYQWIKEAHACRRQYPEMSAEQMAEHLTEHQFLCVHFLDSVDRAVAECTMSDVLTLKRHSNTHWQAAAWRLEKRHPDHFGNRATIRNEVSGPNGAPVQVAQSTTTTDVAVSDLTKEDRERLLKSHMERINAGEPTVRLDLPAQQS